MQLDFRRKVAMTLCSIFGLIGGTLKRVSVHVDASQGSLSELISNVTPIKCARVCSKKSEKNCALHGSSFSLLISLPEERYINKPRAAMTPARTRSTVSASVGKASGAM